MAIEIESSTPFTSVLEQVESELRWVALRLAVQVERTRRQRSVGPPPEYRGLYVTDEEVDSLLATTDEGDSNVERLVEEARTLRQALDNRTVATVEAGYDPPLQRLAIEFRLCREEQYILVIALAPYLEPAYEKIYAYANDDITKRWPTVGLALDVLSDDREETMQLRALFFPDSALCRNHLLVVAESGTPAPSLLNRQIALEPHVAEVLLGYTGLDPALQHVAHVVQPGSESSSVAEALAQVLHDRRSARVYLGGRWQAEKQAAAADAAARVGRQLIVVNGPALAKSSEPLALLPLVLREARLANAALLFQDWPGTDPEALASPFAGQLGARLNEHPAPVFFSDRPAGVTRPPVELHLQIEFPPPTFDDKKRSWRTSAGVEDEDASHLAATYRLGTREIESAAQMAKAIASLDRRADATLADLKAGAQAQSQPQLTSLAQRIVPRFTWDDIILPGDRLAQLHEIASHVLYQHIVYEQWRIAANSSLGKGVAALFAGQSGTGKTMASEIIANDLGLELYKIDLAGLVSKYIGETEKNLSRVFEEASDTNAILFFDEADAVFGKRSEVKDSHDRYANIEVSYLLQKMEEYDGIVILATNLRANLDEAFLRRIRFIVEFPFPEADDRQRIWEHTLKSAAPMNADIDLAFMAKQFRIAGGNIRNIVLFAAFLAARAGTPIGMTHMIQGTKREYQKLGRLLSESDFGRWYDEVRS